MLGSDSLLGFSLLVSIWCIYLMIHYLRKSIERGMEVDSVLFDLTSKIEKRIQELEKQNR